MKNSETGVPTSRWKIDVSLATDVGCQRDRNEDHILFFEPDDPAILQKKGAFAMVADGMGGHMAGGIASELAAKLVKQGYYNDPQEPPLALVAAFEAANRTIYTLSLTDKAYQGMGTTCTALVLKDTSAYCAHIGDSRLYLLRDDRLLRMTEDHSMIIEMVKAGIISAEEARHHPNKSIISQALGARPEINVSTWDAPFQIHEGDIFVLCSDGLYDLVEDDEIREITRSEGLSSACDKLIAVAKGRGGYDNISVGLLKIHKDP